MVKKSQENHRMEYALHKENSSKNYYPETLPYDYNRVILKPVPNIPHSHYINASYVDVSSPCAVSVLFFSPAQDEMFPLFFRVFISPKPILLLKLVRRNRQLLTFGD